MTNWKDSKYKNIQDIKSEKNPDGTDFFSPEELAYFDDPLIGGKLENAQTVAELVEKVKRAEKATKKEEALFNEISLESTNQSLAFRVINFEKGRIEIALFNLSLWIGVADKTEAERSSRIKEIDKEITDKNVKKAANDKLIRGLKVSYGTAIEDEKRAEKILTQRNNLQVILTGSGRLISKDHPEGKELTAITDTYSVKDYSNNNVLVDDESAITDTINGGVATPSQILNHAKNFLDNVKNIDRSKTIQTHYKETALSLYNDRKYNTKNNVIGGIDEFGFSYLWVLRDIGTDKLKKVIEKSGSSKKDQLKKNIEVIIKYISRVEAIVGKEMTSTEAYEYWYGSKVKEYAEAVDKNNDFPKDKFSEFFPIPNYEMIFEFMKEVFPLKTGTSSYELQSKPYLDNINDDDYLKPKDGKKGWEGLTLGGYSFNPKDPSLTDNQKAVIKKQQENVKKIESDTDFKTLTKMWWEIFGPFMNNKWNPSDDSWAAGFKISDGNISDIEASHLRDLECLRFFRTMRGLLLELGISSNIDDYDDHLVKVCQEALKGAIIFPDRSKIIEREKQITGSDHPTVTSGGLTLAIQNNEIWTNVVEWKDYASTKLAGASVTELSVYKQRREDLGGKISSLELDSINYGLQVKDLEAEKKILQGWKDFEEKDLEGKKKVFETIYAKGKWNWDELEQALGYLRLIKKEMNDDAAFDSEFKVKEDSLNKKRSDASLSRAGIDQNWKKLKNKKNGSLSETIKAIMKDEDKKNLTLEMIKGYFDEYVKHLELEDTEKNDLAEIEKAIAEPDKYKDAPQTPVVSEADLKAAFGNIDGVVTKELAEKWGNVGVSKDKIKGIIEKVTDSDKKTPKTKFIEHLKGKGLDDGTKLTEKDDKDKIWKEFLGKDPERVVNTIHTCWLEDSDNKSSTKTAMKDKVKNKDTDDEERLDMTNYGATEKNGEPDEKGMVKYLWEETKGGSGHKYYKIKGESNNGNGGEEEKTGVLNHLKNNWHWYGLAALAIIVLLVVIFWKNISEWWNGPAEEEGQGKDDDDEKKDEDE